MRLLSNCSFIVLQDADEQDKDGNLGGHIEKFAQLGF